MYINEYWLISKIRGWRVGGGVTIFIIENDEVGVARTTSSHIMVKKQWCGLSGLIFKLTSSAQYLCETMGTGWRGKQQLKSHSCFDLCYVDRESLTK